MAVLITYDLKSTIYGRLHAIGNYLSVSHELYLLASVLRE